jgi:hypothetical protein
MQGLTIKTSKSKSSQQQIETYVTSKRSEREFRGLSNMGIIMTQLTQQNDQVEDAWDLRGNNNTPNIKKAKERRKQAYQRYKVQKHISSSIEAKNFIFLNQGDQAGACSFMALMNMYQVAGYANTLPWFQKLKKPTGVRSVYIDMLHLSDDGYSTYQAMAGMGLQNRTFCPDISWNHLLSHFKYEVFRGYGQRWNNSIQGLATTHGEYDENVQNWLDNKLEDGCIIAVPFMQHFCCIIGHDENHFLFLNSYGVLHDQGGLSPMLMYTKRQVASVINDCFYWTPGAVTTSTTTKKTTAKKTTAKKTTAKKTTTNKTTSRKHPKKTTAKKTTTTHVIADDDILKTDSCPETCTIALFKQFYTTF